MYVYTHFFRPTLKEAAKNAGEQPLHKVIICFKGQMNQNLDIFFIWVQYVH